MSPPSNEDNDPISEGWDHPLFDSYLPMHHKLEYILKPKHYAKQEKASCLICKIIQKDQTVDRFEVYRNDSVIIFLNIYPYTPGHLMISPLKHKLGYEELDPEEILEISKLTQRCIEMLKHFSRTESFNIGWNQGLFAGGSIKHFHIHVVPRYRNELNFIEIIAKTKPIIVSLQDTETYLQRYVPFLKGDKTLEEVLNK
jgi:ATP adenylyltransferase